MAFQFFVLMATESDDLPLDLSIKRNSTSTTASNASEIVQLLTRHRYRRHPCLTCGIGFSSVKTLHAHLQFYCATKPTDAALTTPPEPNVQSETSQSIKTEPMDEESVAPPTQLSETSEASRTSLAGHYCTFCAFRANTPRGLRSHVTKYHFKEVKNVQTKEGRPRGNRQSVIVSAKRPKIVGSQAPPVASVPEKRKYCKYCDIYFKYLSTFLAHRKFYCTVRKGPGDEPAAAAGSAVKPKCSDGEPEAKGN